MDGRELEFEKAAQPLVDYLSKLSVKDPVHDYVLADIYDMVNDKRDEEIGSAQEAIFTIRTSADFLHDLEKRRMITNLQTRIRQLQGA